MSCRGRTSGLVVRLKEDEGFCPSSFFRSAATLVWNVIHTKIFFKEVSIEDIKL